MVQNAKALDPPKFYKREEDSSRIMGQYDVEYGSDHYLGAKIGRTLFLLEKSLHRMSHLL